MDIDYLIAFGPIALAHLAVPPLSVFDRREHPALGIFEVLYDLWPPGKLTSKNVRSLALTAHDFSNPITHKHVTYMFVHETYAHLMNNLLGAFQCGCNVYRQIGSGMYLVYIGGGVAAALPSLLKFEQRKMHAQSLLSSFIPARWLSSDSPLVDIVQHGIGQMSVFCGSSGGLCALMGCSMMLFVQDVSSVMYRKNAELAAHDAEMERILRVATDRHGANVSSLNQQNAAEQYSNWKHSWPRRLLSRSAEILGALGSSGLLLRGLDALNIARILYTDAKHFFPTGPSASIDSLGNQISRVDRAGHLQGALFGMAFALLRYSWIRSAPPSTGTRRTTV